LEDEKAMRAAIDEAASTCGTTTPDVPVGAVVVSDGRIIGRGRNQVEATGDPTMHAEIVAIREAVVSAGAARLPDATMYVTLEPCLMCAGAIIQARIARVVYGCDDPKAGAVKSLYTALSDPRLNHRCQVDSGVLAEEAADLLKGFFRNLRRRGRRFGQ